MKTKYFINENGIEMKTDIYDNGMIITQEANPYIPEPEAPEPSQLDRIEQTVNAIANSENSEALNVLLGM